MDMLGECLLFAYLLTDGDATWGVMLTHNLKWIILGYLVASIVQTFAFWIFNISLEWRRKLGGLRGLYVGAWAPIVSPRFETTTFERALLGFCIFTIYKNRKMIFAQRKNHVSPIQILSSDEEYWSDEYTLSSSDEGVK